MIKLVNVGKRFKDNKLYESVNINISSPGLYGIIGKSGSGKSTLLNIIGLLDDEFEGEYYFDDINVKKMKEKEKENIRFNHISFIFQSPKLIENESILTNLMLGIGRKVSNDEVVRLLNRVNLKVKPSQKINTLSGGEKQRVNLALALLKDSSLILGDEITSGLDEKNKKEIFDILLELSKTKIIILVTHDAELLKKYTDKIYKIENKQIPKIIEKGDIILKEDNKRKNTLKDSYIIRHVLNIIKRKRIRTLASVFSSVIALVCLGICLLLTSSFSSSIMSSLGDLINQNQIVMEKSDDSYLIDEDIIISKDEIISIQDSLLDNVLYRGVKYQNSFKDFFISQNDFTLKMGEKELSLDGYSIDSINEFSYFYDDGTDYLYTPSFDLKDNEVIISLSKGKINALCNLLEIEYSNDGSLLPYFIENNVKLYIEIANANWDYYLTIPLRVVGYEVSMKKHLFHSNPLWNEHIIEGVMQLPYSYKLNEIDYYPWTTKKINYLALKENKELETIERFIKDENFNDYIFKTFYLNDYSCIYFEYAHDNSLRISDIEKIIKENDELSSYIPCSNNGFTLVKEALMTGFSYPTFICNDYQLIEEYIEYNAYSEQNLGSYQSTLLTNTSDYLYSLNILDSSKENSIHIKSYMDENTKLIGRYPVNEKEIIISSKLAKLLNINQNEGLFREKQGFIFGLTGVTYANGRYKNNYEITKIKIVGIIEDDSENYLYVNRLWVMTFSMLHLDKSEKELFPNSALFEYGGDNINKTLEELNSKYSYLNFSNPYLEYKTQLDSTVSYIEVGLGIFSSFCLFSSLLMEIMASYLFVIDTKKEIGIYTYLGYKKKSIKNQFKMFSSLLSIYSCFISSFSLLVVMTLLNSGQLGIEIPFNSTSITPFLVIIILSYIISKLSSYLSIRKTLKVKPIKQLQEN